MAKMVKLTVDGVDFKAPEGMNIIDAAELAGIHIPNLCYLKGMKGIGACRLCLVDVEGGRGPAIACNTKVKEGMVINTQTDEIIEARKFVIDLIVSMHPLDCMTCTKGGNCNLQKYAYDFEIQESSFSRKRFGHPVDQGNPFIKMSPDYCILCGRCVRVCKEQGTNVLEFMGRGVGAKVTTVVDRALHESDCTFCGSCVDACPVNAIVEYDRVRKGREWEYEKLNSTCNHCGNACDITVSVKDDQIMKINASVDQDSVAKYICAYGRFGYDYLQSDQRLMTPMKRVKGELVETTWKDAIKIVSDELAKSGEKTGIISTARLSNESALAYKNFATKVLKTKDFDTTMSLYSDADIYKNSDKILLEGADLVILTGIDPSQRERVIPGLNVQIRKHVARGGKLIVINSGETKLGKIATFDLQGDEAAILMGLTKAAIDKGVKADKKLTDAVKGGKPTEDIEAAAEAFAKADNPVIFSSPAMFDASSNLTLMKGKIAAISFESNSKGVGLMGLNGKGKSFKDMASKGVDTMIAVGDVPVTQKPEKNKFLVVVNSHISELSKQADVLLPPTTYLEVSGTMVDFKGRIKHFTRMVEAAGKSKTNFDILRDLSKALGTKSFAKINESDIKKIYSDAKPKRKLMPFKKRTEIDVKPEMILESVSSSLLAASRLFWLKETERTSVSK